MLHFLEAGDAKGSDFLVILKINYSSLILWKIWDRKMSDWQIELERWKKCGTWVYIAPADLTLQSSHTYVSLWEYWAEDCFGTSKMYWCNRCDNQPLVYWHSKLLGIRACFAAQLLKLQPAPNFLDSIIWLWANLSPFCSLLWCSADIASVLYSMSCCLCIKYLQ